MQKKRSIKIISIVLILVLICVSITYVKSGNKEVIATTKEFNSENLQDNEHMHVEIDSTGDKVPVPNGYVGSNATGENEIDTGYVIYEGEEEVNDSNVEEAQKTRNQYVWIPVPDASTMYGTDKNGKKWGKLYDFSTTVIDNTEELGEIPLNWIENRGVMQILSKNTSREPDLTKTNDMDSKIKSLKIGEVNMHVFLMQLEKEFNTMIENVEKYGGFYIGRYETGNLNANNSVVQKGNEDISNKTWYEMYNSCKNLKGDNDNIETGLIWGCQWDRTLMWLIESGNKTYTDISRELDSWGNYKNVEFEYVNNAGIKIIKNKGKANIIPTGSTEYTKANNIYDLSGNVTDWTMESQNDINRICRGGGYTYNGDEDTINRAGILSNQAYIGRGGRAMLYIK